MCRKLERKTSTKVIGQELYAINPNHPDWDYIQKTRGLLLDCKESDVKRGDFIIRKVKNQ